MREREIESHTVVVVCEMRLVIAVHWRTGERERERATLWWWFVK